MKKIKLNISGMHCVSCSTLIEKSLKKLDGVKISNVNFSTSNANIEYNESKISENDFIKKIKSLGYSANLEKDRKKQEQREKEEISNLKEKLLCQKVLRKRLKILKNMMTLPFLFTLNQNLQVLEGKNLKFLK